MDDGERVLARLKRIEALRGGVAVHTAADGASLREIGAPLREILAELQALVPEAEAWVRSAGGTRAGATATKLRKEAEGMR